MNMFKSASAVALAVVLTGAGATFQSVRAEEPAAAGAVKYSMAKFKALAAEALKLVEANDFPGAQKKTLELESSWDDGTKELKAADRKVWNMIDKQMDVAIDVCKAAKSQKKAEEALKDFIAKLTQAEKVK